MFLNKYLSFIKIKDNSTFLHSRLNLLNQDPNKEFNASY